LKFSQEEADTVSELITDFQSLPEEYQQVIRLAQDEYKITIAPLQLLVGGWSGAVVYLVSVSENDSGRVEHCILKLDRKSKTSKSDEVARHNTATSKSTLDFARDHIAELVFDRVEHEGAMAIFYRIAGQSLLNYRPLSSYGQQSQLKTIFAATNTVLLKEWNVNLALEQAVHPQKVLETWLGFRLKPGGNTERFLQSVCQVNPDIPGFLINGNVFPNPLIYAREPGNWGKARPIDIALGLIHGDLNTNNILVKFSDNGEALEGYYLIDFALFKEGMPLLYDQRYLEMSYLLLSMSQVSFAKVVNLLTRMAEVDILEPHKAPIELSGVSAVIASARSAFAAWLEENHPSLQDDLWGQYWLAGVAAGLGYCHKEGLSDEQRLAGLVYAATNLKRYATVFKLPLPAGVELLYNEGQAGTSSPGSPMARKAHHNLPAQPTPFVGRTAQISALKELLLGADTRLITLIGPGGTGKTRLSLQAAQEVLDQFPDGVFFVPLADDTDPNQFVSRVAQQLEVREGGRPLLENVKDYLYDKQLLLVLDNFEQLVSAGPLAADLLAAAPRLKVLVSSRIALNLHGEREFPVPPLELPQTAGELTVENLAGNESVRLFVERAQAVHPNFELTNENASTVAEICQRLDGLPLALELAAARVKLLPPQAILARLDDRFKLLTGGARDLPARHQTLRNTLEWSYGLLNQDEKTLYARLSVFVGGFTLEAAEAVCNPDGQLDILEGLTSLVNNSLLRQEETDDGEPRFGMLETIRAYALERLADSGKMGALREQHARYFGDLITNQAMFQLYSAKALYWLNWLERENGNVRATLTWSLASPQGIELGARIVMALNWFWYRRGYFIEGGMWAERVLANPAMQTPSQPRALALVSSGLLALWQGKQDIALAQLQESLEIELRLEDEQFVAQLFMGNAVALINMGRDSAAQPYLQEALPMFKEQDNAPFHAITLVHLGNVELGLGNPEQARALHSEALAEARAIGENWLLSFALNNLGEVARTQGQYELARKYYEECEALLRDTGDRGDMARFAHSLGYVAQYEGDYARAETQFRKSLAMFRRLGNRRGIAECLAGLAGLRARQGQPQWGATMLSAAETLLQVTGGAWWPADRLEVERNQEIIRSALDEAELTAAQEKGRAMTLEQALAFAAEDV
jgi:predicted ATPase